MALLEPGALGRNLLAFAKTETTFGTFVKPATADAIRVLRFDMSYAQERKDRMDKRNTRSIQSRFSGKKTCTWEVETYVLPSGTAGTPPDVHALLIGTIGGTAGYTNTGGTSDAYTPTYSQSDLGSVSLVRFVKDESLTVSGGHGGLVMEAMKGCWVDSMAINISGGSEPRFTFSGGAADHIFTGTTRQDGAIDNATNTTLTFEQLGTGEVGSVVAVVHAGGHHTDLEVSAGDLATAAKTVPSTDMSTAVTNPPDDTNVVDGAAIFPYVPAQTLASDTPLGGITGTFTLVAASSFVINGDDSSTDTLSSAQDTFHFTEFELTVNNNVKAHNDEALTDKANDYSLGFREVTGSISFRARKDLIVTIGLAKKFHATDLQVVVGDTAGSKMTIDLDQVEFDTHALEIPEAEEAIITLPFKALGDATGDDELTITFA